MKREYRHELKFYINNLEYIELSNRLSRIMKHDSFADERGNYFIRSLYFDDYDDAAFRTKLDGINLRDKYRLRTYNMQDDVVKLERKHKEGQFVLKDSVNISAEDAKRLIAGDPSCLLRYSSPFAKQMYREFRTTGLKPRVIVDYTREAYVHPLEDVRITFDKNLHTGFRNIRLFEDIPTFPVLDDYGMIMEVKFNRSLPVFLRSLIQLEAHARSAISKYCICRKFEL